MKVGFTGTRFGMTDAQKATVRRLLVELGGTEFHHGDCVGADAEAQEIAGELGVTRVVHPPVDAKLRAFCKDYIECRAPKTHFARNRDIVSETDCLIGTPKVAGPITVMTLGGTAYTVNYARKRNRPVYVVEPDGSVQQ
jgi:hypothetical protein